MCRRLLYGHCRKNGHAEKHTRFANAQAHTHALINERWTRNARDPRVPDESDK